ncbi:MAG: hypothetical protein QM689_12805 [Oscillospiraceae bacterium]
MIKLDKSMTKTELIAAQNTNNAAVSAGTTEGMRTKVITSSFDIASGATNYGGGLSVTGVFDHVISAYATLLGSAVTYSSFRQYMTTGGNSEIVNIAYALSCTAPNSTVTQNVRIVIIGYDD